MAKIKKPKPVAECLNQRQWVAVDDAIGGDYFPIVQCCMECLTAENKAVEASKLGITTWGKNTYEHYNRIRTYLEKFIKDAKVLEAYQLMIAKRESNG